MFITEKVPALFKQGKLKLVANDEGGVRRVAEATLVIEPFPPALAHELGEDIAGHLFDEADAIRPELEGIDLRVRCGLQAVQVAHHEELEPVARLTPVSVKDVSVVRVEDKKSSRVWLSLSFVLVFSLEERSARNFVLDEFGRTLVWTFSALQRELLEQADLHDSIAKLGEGEGNCTLSVAGHEPVTFDAETSKQHRAKAKQLRQQAGRQTH